MKTAKAKNVIPAAVTPHNPEQQAIIKKLAKVPIEQLMRVKNQMADEINERELEKIEIIRDYDSTGHWGIGYMDGKLVEFKADRGDELTIKEITLAESLDWLIGAGHYLGGYIGSHSSTPGALINWLKNIKGKMA